MAAPIHAIYTIVGDGFIPILIMIPSLILIQRNLAQKRQRRQGIVVVIQPKEEKSDA